MATDIERLVVQLSANIKSYENALNRAMGVTNQRTKAIESRFERMNKNINASFANTLKAGAAVGAGAFSAREVMQYADAWTQAGNMIAAAAQSAGVQTRSLEDLRKGADEARTSLETYVDLYARLIRSASGVAKSEEEIALATSLVSKAMKAGGASTQEQAASILQLGQALGSGVLQGDELRSLRENAPIVAKAIADEFGVTIAGLKQLGSEGKLTSDRVFRAIINAQKPIEAQFAKTNATIADSFTRLRNNVIQYVGTADSSSGVSVRLGQALGLLADNIGIVADAVLVLSGALLVNYAGRAVGGAISATYGLIAANVAERAATVASARAALEAAQTKQAAAAANLRYAETALVAARNGTALGLSVAKASRDMVVAQTAMARSTTAVTAASTATTAAMARVGVVATATAGAVSVLNGALALVGGPGGAALLAAYAIYQFSSSQTDAQEAAEVHGKSLKELTFQIETLDWANKTAVDSTRQKIAADIDAAKVALARAKAERELAASIVKDAVEPEMKLYPSPDATDVQNTVDNSPAVKDRQDLIDTIEKQVADLEKVQKDFEDVASGRKKPTRNTDGFGGGIAGADGGSGKKKRKNEYEREVQQIKDRTAALQAETAAQAGLNPLINDYGYSTARAKAAQDLLSAAQKAGTAAGKELKDVQQLLRGEFDGLSPAARKQAESMLQLATNYGVATEASQRFEEKQEEIKKKAEDALNTAKDVVSGMIDGFIEGEKAADIFANSLKKIGKALIDDVLSSIFKVQNAGGSGGLLGGLFSLFGGGQFGIASGGGIGLYASGGYTGPGGKNQPAGIVHKGEVVFSQADVARMGGVAAVEALRRGYADGGPVGVRAPTLPRVAPRTAQSAITAPISINIDATGADAAGLARVEQRLAALQRELPGTIVKTVKDAQQRRGL
ncbi:tape measure protein [Shinella fusca]|uniref:Tape measure domain-containing protein n=1 Tax=Shinella fusca TaxID=544480 RepID=A0A7W8DTT7_9HYPH|nr:tape measure protein [Shinella fusca]MBB5041927.1 tape measure domain-containing protein [Shinella fusca]